LRIENCGLWMVDGILGRGRSGDGKEDEFMRGRWKRLACVRPGALLPDPRLVLSAPLS